MKKYIIILLALPLIASSCLKDDEDKFDKSSGERMQEYLENTGKVLAAAPNGWVVEYYPSATQEYGGVRMYMKFDEKNNVTIASEAGKPDQTEESSFSFGEDFGPTLNFDLENTLLNYYTQPYGSVGEANVGWGGDFEFIIMSVDEDKVVLRGKKTKNTVILTPAATSDWAADFQAYQDAVSEMDDMVSYQLELGGKVYLMSRDVDYNYKSRHFTFATTPLVGVGFIYTPTGIKFYEPVTIDNVTISEMEWNDGEYVHAASGAKIVPIQTDHTFQVATSNVKVKTAKVAVVPSNQEIYYVVGAYSVADSQNKTDDQIINEMMSNIYSVSDLHQGTLDGAKSVTVKVKKAETEYVACAFAVEIVNDYIYPSTGLFKSAPFTTLKDVDMNPDYGAWLGTWTLTSTTSEENKLPVVMDIVIDENTRNSTYEIYGWDISMFRNTYPQRAVFSNNDLVIKGFMHELGRYQDYIITWAAMSLFTNTGTDDDNKTWLLNVSTPFTCSLNAGGQSATVTPQSGELDPTGEYVVTSMNIFRVRDETYYYAPAAPGYTMGDFPRGPYTMVKKSDSTTVTPVVAGGKSGYPTFVVDLGAYTRIKNNAIR